MDIFIKLSAAALLPVIVSAAMYTADKKTVFGKLSNKSKQLIYGIVFGIIAVMGTEFGVNMSGATMNSRAAAVLCAGLVFGAPAGIIAGIIGGVERYFAVMWGAGAYTQLACSISTCLAGFIAATLRKYMFDNKKPSALYALLIGFMAEVLHMMLVFFTNMQDIERAFSVVELCAPPMILINGIALMLSVAVIKFISGEKLFKENTSQKITSVFQRWLSICVLVAFCFTVSFTLVLQQRIFVNDTNELLDINISDVVDDISDASDSNLLELTHRVKAMITDGEDIFDIAQSNNIAEINIINDKGIISQSTNSDFVNYDMRNGEQSGEFMVLLEDKKELVQSYQPISYATDVYRKYAGVVLDDGGFVQVGYDAEHFQQDIDKEVVFAAKNRHVGQSGSMIIVNENWNIVSDSNNNEGKNLFATGLWIDTQKNSENVCYEAEIYGQECFYMYSVSEGYYIISVIPKSEAVFTRNLSVYLTVFIEIIVFAALFILVYFLIKRLVVNNIRKINQSLSEITGGNLDVVVNVRSNEEFASLSDDINSTVVTLKHYIDDAAARIDEELKFAKDIQHSALPSIFPPFPEHKEFEIFASMHTAKEVGGDFYDFFLAGGDKLAFLIADVSGKGIPAAMFMMSAKSLIKGYAESGRSADEAFTLANEKLCEGNDAGMFVTAWLGIINLETGEMEYANAGHNPPLIKKADGEFEYLKSRPGFVLAGMEGITYRKNTLSLEKGDRIYLYTDGVTEATNRAENLYGEDRLKNVLNTSLNLSAEELCCAVKKDVDDFVGDAPQFDDITMLCFDYIGKPSKEITVVPELERMAEVTEFVENVFSENEVPMGAVMKMNIAVDEIFSNIVKFSEASYVRIICYTENDSAVLVFEDDGIEYNPLIQKEPDTTLSADEREIGGLGIFMVKKSMTSMDYEYKDGKNILSLKLEYKGK